LTEGVQRQHGGEMKLPAISIITPCRNGVRYLSEALESLHRQHYPYLEHLVLDAGSTDGSLEVLARYSGSTVVSEPDSGSHDAMNKGVARATGDVIGFLNVDDFYPDGVLHDVGRLMAADPQVDVVVGQSIVFEDDERGRHIVSLRTHSRGDGFWMPELTFGVPGFCGCFFRRRVFKHVGSFVNDYDIAGDRHFLMRVALAGMRPALLNKPAIWYRLHAGSRTINRAKPNLVEISREYFRMGLELSRASADHREMRRCFLAWNAFEGAKLVVRDLTAGHVQLAAQTFVELSRQNPLWPLRLVHALPLRAAVHRLDAPTPVSLIPSGQTASGTE
jgi:glycosyltransferase involved in cell wall biosynthesis